MIGLFGLRTVLHPISRPLSQITRGIYTDTLSLRGNIEQRKEFDWWEYHGGRRISTLNSQRLTVEDILDFSNFDPRSAGQRIHFDGIYPDVWIHPTENPNCAGFLYYHSRPGLPALASSLRLRLISTPSVEAFQTGRDFCLNSGLVWQIMAGQIAVYDSYEGIRKQLVREGLWTKDDHSDIFSVFGDRRVLYPDRTLFRLEQPFPFTLHNNLTLTVVGKSEQRKFSLRVLETEDYVRRWHFSGDTIARFERSNHPDHVASPAVCIRILRALTPIHRLDHGYIGPYCEPMTGELLSVLTLSGEIRPWAYPLTKNANSKALSLLIDQCL
ncbi:hypothetical protein C8R44DRAFT_808928 [Mycena epipterygia]|nr:hypothetical protein C8R44DRAFT_808928 [Mycena epipterygia]